MCVKEIIGLCTACAILSTVRSLPIESVPTHSIGIYRLVPVDYESRNLVSSAISQKTKRDIFPENVSLQQPNESEGADDQKVTETDHKDIVDANGQPNNAKVSSRGDVGSSKKDSVVGTKNQEILKLAADTAYPAVYRVRRRSEANQRSDYYYDDSDYAGYDRKGAMVGYQDRDDDFPTVVW